VSPRTAEERLRAAALGLRDHIAGPFVGTVHSLVDDCWDEFYAALAVEPAPVPEVDAARLRQAFLNAGLMWVIPPKEFEESVRVVAHEYDNLGVLAASLATPPEPKP